MATRCSVSSWPPRLVNGLPCFHSRVAGFSMSTRSLSPVASSFAASTSLGPLTVSVDRVGAQALLAFHDGNLGPIDVALDFKPPSGIGLALDISGIASGGGFLFHDVTTSTYAGVLQLSIY